MSTTSAWRTTCSCARGCGSGELFTGLIADVGAVADLEATPDGARVRVASPVAGELSDGDSVAVNGVCLTATAVEEGTFRADLMHETLRRSSLGALRAGDAVNLELPLRASDRLGGHIVQGHVDGVGTVAGVREEGFARVLTLTAPPALLRYMVEKGSIAIEGVSLTVAALDDTRVSVSLIPETLQRTTLGRAGPGSPVNLEVDVLAKHVERLMAR